MRTLWLASPGPADAPPPNSACGPAVAGSEGLPCPAPGGCGSLLFGPSDPLTTGVTCGVLAGFARGRESALCPRPSVTRVARRCAGLGPARPLPRPPPVVTPASPSPPASPPTFPPFPHFLGGAGGTLERKSGNRSFKASPVMSERVAAGPRLASRRKHQTPGLWPQLCRRVSGRAQGTRPRPPALPRREAAGAASEASAGWTVPEALCSPLHQSTLPSRPAPALSARAAGGVWGQREFPGAKKPSEPPALQGRGVGATGAGSWNTRLTVTLAPCQQGGSVDMVLSRAVGGNRRPMSFDILSRVKAGSPPSLLQRSVW